MNESSNISRKWAWIAREGLWQVDAGYRFQDLNPRMAQILGRDSSELIGESLIEFIDPDWRPMVEQIARDATAEAPQTIDIVWRGADDQPVTCKTVFHRENGDSEGWYGSCSVRSSAGISTRENSVSKPRNAQPAIDADVDGDGDGDGTSWRWETDKEGRISFLGENFYRVSNLSPSDVIGKTREQIYTELWQRPHQLKLESKVRHLSEATAPTGFESVPVLFPRRDSTIFQFRSSGQPVFSKTGEYLALRGVSVDVTEFEETKSNIRMADDLLAELLDDSPFGVAVVKHIEREGEIKLRRVLTNQTLVTMFGYETATEFTAADAAKSMVDLSQFAYIGRTLSSGGRLVELVSECVRLDGKRFWVLMNTSRIRFGGDDCTVVWHVDISDRIKAERELKVNEQKIRELNDTLEQRVKTRTRILHEREIELLASKEEAERANQAKSEFLSAMSHELRTPLNAVLGFGQLLEIDSEQPLVGFQVEAVDQILNGGRHLLNLVDDVLNLSKIEEGKLALNIEDIDVGSVIEKCLSALRPLAASSEIDMRTVVREGPKLTIRADRTRLEQVLINILSNAIKYNKPAGTVRAGFDDWLIRPVKGPPIPGVRISVADTGFGIPFDKHEGIFEPFDRLGRESGEIEGSGIGLTISKRLVELMGGEIGFDSIDGRGTTFWITFPRSS